jgi:hypothetical protein
MKYILGSIVILVIVAGGYSGYKILTYKPPQFEHIAQNPPSENSKEAWEAKKAGCEATPVTKNEKASVHKFSEEGRRVIVSDTTIYACDDGEGQKVLYIY